MSTDNIIGKKYEADYEISFEKIKEFLSTKRGSTVRVYKPVRGEKRKLVQMVSNNAREGLDQHRVKKFPTSYSMKI